jgi:hypothetical protein
VVGTLAVALGWCGGPATYLMTAESFLAVSRWGGCLVLFLDVR